MKPKSKPTKSKGSGPPPSNSMLSYLNQDDPYKKACERICTTFIQLYQNLPDPTNATVENVESDEFFREATQCYQPFRDALADWYPKFRQRMMAHGAIFVTEPQLASELCSILRSHFPYASVEFTFDHGQHRIDIFIPSAQDGRLPRAFIVEIAYYFGSEKEKKYCKRDVEELKRLGKDVPHYLEKISHFGVITAIEKLGRKVEQV